MFKYEIIQFFTKSDKNFILYVVFFSVDVAWLYKNISDFINEFKIQDSNI